jgi:hypothetical protein
LRIREKSAAGARVRCAHCQAILVQGFDDLHRQERLELLHVGIERAAGFAALNASASELAVLSRDINHLTHLLRIGSVAAAREYRGRLATLDGDVRKHLELGGPHCTSNQIQKVATALVRHSPSFKLMGSGEYVVERPGGPPIGHFGLAVRDYTHSTAPNRRFPDLITLRMVKAVLAGRQAPYSVAELGALAEHCTAQEDAAQKVERRMRKSEAALLLESHVGQQYDAIVTGSSQTDTWVRIFAPPAEGRLESGPRGLEVGQQIRVKLVSTDVERGFIDFVAVD